MKYRYIRQVRNFGDSYWTWQLGNLGRIDIFGNLTTLETIDGAGN